MGKAAHRSILSPEDQRVTFVELFFDLVFVFSVTQVVGLLHHHLDWTGVGQTILIFWLVWWGWTQFTWALNAADTTHPSVELATLVATLGGIDERSIAIEGDVLLVSRPVEQAAADALAWLRQRVPPLVDLALKLERIEDSLREYEAYLSLTDDGEMAAQVEKLAERARATLAERQRQ